MRKFALALAIVLSCGCATAQKVGGRVLFSGPIGGGGAGGGTPITWPLTVPDGNNPGIIGPSNDSFGLYGNVGQDLVFYADNGNGAGLEVQSAGGWDINTRSAGSLGQSAAGVFTFSNGGAIATISSSTGLSLIGSNMFLSWTEHAAPGALPAAGTSAIYMNSTSHTLKVSQNGGAYADLVGGGGGAAINPTTSIITIGDGLGSVVQVVGPTDRTTWFASGTPDAVNGNGNEFDIIAHNGGSTTGRGGLLYLSGGDAVAGNNFGGAGQLWGGNGKGSQHGGNLDTGGGNGGATGVGGNWSGLSGNGGGTSGNGGSWTGGAGNATSGFGGTTTLKAGGTASGTSGQIQLRVCPDNSTTLESALTIDGAAAGSNGYLRVIPIADAGGFLTHLGDHDTGFGALYLDYTGTATVGNVAMQTPTGRVNVAATATTVTVTNGLCKAKSKVFAIVSSNDATAYVKNTVAGAGSFTINLGAAATAQCSIDFLIIGAD